MLKPQKQLNKSQNHQTKLPLIKTKTSQTLIPQRPSSSNKVQQLHRKLLNKFQDYQETLKAKPITGKNKKKGSQLIQTKLVAEKDCKGYQKIQKLMPQLYVKIKDIHDSENTITTANYLTQKQPNTKAKQVKQIQQVYYLTEKPSDQPEATTDDMEMSQFEINQIFDKYITDEGLDQQSPSEDLIAMQKQLLKCQHQIDNIGESMCQLVRDIAYQFTNPLLDEQQN